MKDSTELFSRNLGTLTQAQQDRLQQSRVAVVGCGGLGGYVIEELVRAGVGELHCFDPDAFSLSNCNRQLNATIKTLGKNKAEVATARATDIHGQTIVRPYPGDFRDFLTTEAFAVQLVIDCLDNIEARLDLSAVCRENGLPLVHGAVREWYGQVGVQPADGDLLERLYPRQEKDQESVPSPPSVLASTVAMVASLEVSEAIKLLIGIPSPLVNHWLLIDLKELEFTIIG